MAKQASTMNSFEFILATLAVWRLTHLIAAEDGPFNALAWLRGKAGQGFWATLLDCFYCLSIWIALLFAIGMGGSLLHKVLLWLALSAAAILLNRVIDRVAPDPPVYFEEPETKIKEDV
jgi:hypothetical protein